MNIEVTRQNGDLVEEYWRFYFYENRHTLYLDIYEYRTRQSKRHKFREVNGRSYSRLGRSYMDYVKVEQVPFPEDVKEEARQKFMATLKVDVWPKGG